MWPILPCGQVFKLEKLHKFKLQKVHRIKSQKLFQKVYKSGRSIVDPMAVMYILPGTTKGPSVGLAVGKKLGNAVVRNHVKRMMREVFRVRKNELQQNVNIVWVARKKLVTADIKTYDRVFYRLAKRAGLMD